MCTHGAPIGDRNAGNATCPTSQVSCAMCFFLQANGTCSVSANVPPATNPVANGWFAAGGTWTPNGTNQGITQCPAGWTGSGNAPAPFNTTFGRCQLSDCFRIETVPNGQRLCYWSVPNNSYSLNCQTICNTGFSLVENQCAQNQINPVLDRCGGTGGSDQYRVRNNFGWRVSGAPFSVPPNGYAGVGHTMTAPHSMPTMANATLVGIYQGTSCAALGRRLINANRTVASVDTSGIGANIFARWECNPGTVWNGSACVAITITLNKAGGQNNLTASIAGGGTMTAGAGAANQVVTCNINGVCRLPRTTGGAAANNLQKAWPWNAVNSRYRTSIGIAGFQGATGTNANIGGVNSVGAGNVADFQSTFGWWCTETHGRGTCFRVGNENGTNFNFTQNTTLFAAWAPVSQQWINNSPGATANGTVQQPGAGYWTPTNIISAGNRLFFPHNRYRCFNNGTTIGNNIWASTFADCVTGTMSFCGAILASGVDTFGGWTPVCNNFSCNMSASISINPSYGDGDDITDGVIRMHLQTGLYAGHQITNLWSWNPQCVQCQAGTFSPAGSNTCHACGLEHFSNAGAGSCTLCPAGYRSNTNWAGAGQSSCIAQCMPGQAVITVGGQCECVGSGHHSVRHIVHHGSVSNASQRIACPANHSSSGCGPGATSASDCIPSVTLRHSQDAGIGVLMRATGSGMTGQSLAVQSGANTYFGNLSVNQTTGAVSVNVGGTVHWLTPNQRQLITCPAGQHLPANSNVCTACPSGAHCPGGRFPSFAPTAAGDFRLFGDGIRWTNW